MVIKKIKTRKIFFGILLLLFAPLCVYGQQERPRLVVLPFSGGSGQDGELIAGWLEGDLAKMGFFDVIARSRVSSIMSALKFQREGLTDPNTVIGIGDSLDAQFVVSGHIQTLGSNNLLIISIINRAVRKLQFTNSFD